MELDDIEGAGAGESEDGRGKGKLKVWIRRVWTLEMVSYYKSTMEC